MPIATSTSSSASSPGSATARWARTLGLVLMVLGFLVLAWALLVWRWQDPFTALYTLYEQRQLSGVYDRRSGDFLREQRPILADRRPPAPAAERANSATTKPVIPALARAYRLTSGEGDPLGRIIVPRLGLNMIFVDGTSTSSLERGPGRDLETTMPGEGRLVYIAGHRTTYLAPFAHIDSLRRGDRITLEVPYATFVYAVTREIVVPANDLSVLRLGHRELLALQACHPRFFATHRYIVYARPIKVIPARANPPSRTVQR
jgi:sortase A